MSPLLAATETSTAPGPVICAWCRVVMKPGDPRSLASHGVCLPCAENLLDAKGELTPIPARLARRAASEA